MPVPLDPHAPPFRYAGWDLEVAADRATATLRSRYELGEHRFEERVDLAADPAALASADPTQVEEAARLVHLLSGVSYFKALAPGRIEVDAPGLTDAQRALLTALYVDGLAEYAVVNDLDLSGLVIDADRRPDPPGPSAPPGAPSGPAAAADPDTTPGRPLVPFGGGIDSIVTVDGIRQVTADTALFVLSKGGDRFAALEAAAAVTGLPVVRAERRLDPAVLRSAELGWRNGHVPITGILSSIALLAAVLQGRDAVVMSNEWSASSGTVVVDGRPVNHQWSKSLAFEDLLRAAVASTAPPSPAAPPPEYFSWLRARSELWVTRRFAELTAFHPVFRSCNRAFHIDPDRRLDHWCGVCDKCCFVDLALAPFMAAEDLRVVFAGREPLDDPELIDRFRGLIGAADTDKPFECVGDIDESRTAAALALGRADRASSPVLRALAADLPPSFLDDPAAHLARLDTPLGPDRTPPRYAPRPVLD